MHIRIVNGHTRIIETKEALAEINHAMMDGSDSVEEMSASRSTASILYKDGRKVTLRPATEDEIESSKEREWSRAHSSVQLYHRFDGDLRALCNRGIAAKVATRVMIRNQDTGMWERRDLVGHQNLYTRKQVEQWSVKLCPKCLAK